MSRYDPQRGRRLTTRANTSAVEALLDGEPSRPRRRATVADPAEARRTSADGERAFERAVDGAAGVAGTGTTPPAARGGCLTALLGLGGRRS